ncbi:MAG: nucleotidyl transferase AbiEii/AbiGii toxin family protein [Bacteroidota bacterium]
MILPKEINKYAAENKVSDKQIEKDYVLTWMLNGIANHKVLSQAMVFKGGTVLKKCYIEDYRFSEDLDFTLLDERFTHAQLKTMLEEVFVWVKEESNLTLEHKADDIHKESGSSLFYVNYIGPLGGNMGSRDIKIDITRGEKMEFPVEIREVYITYSDLPEESFRLQCYPLSEVLIEKMAALMGRTEPRDLYDFWYLTEIEGMNPRENLGEFNSKAKHKGQDPAQFAAKVLKKEAIFEKGWEAKLRNQIHDLPKFDDVMRRSRKYLK